MVMLHHEQNIWKMGGLGGNLRLTFVTFVIGTLALIGCPPFGGFFSKDAILSLAYETTRNFLARAVYRIPDRVLHGAVVRCRLLR